MALPSCPRPRRRPRCPRGFAKPAAEGGGVREASGPPCWFTRHEIGSLVRRGLASRHWRPLWHRDRGRGVDLVSNWSRIGAPGTSRPRVRHAAEVFPRAFLAAVGAQPPPTRNRRRAVQRRIVQPFWVPRKGPAPRCAQALGPGPHMAPSVPKPRAAMGRGHQAPGPRHPAPRTPRAKSCVPMA